MKDEEDVLNQSAEILKQDTDLIEEVKHGGRERSESRGSTQEILKNPQPITEAVLMKGTSLKREKKESVEKFLGRLNQLYLNEKSITQIVSLLYDVASSYTNRIIYKLARSSRLYIYMAIAFTRLRI